MCFAVTCGKCGKQTWGGCGLHVASVYARIAEGQHCRCSAWPGVPAPLKPTTTTPPPAAAAPPPPAAPPAPTSSHQNLASSIASK